MATNLPPRTTDGSAADHVADHNIIHTAVNALTAKVVVFTDDLRLSDTRTPTNASVTLAKLAPDVTAAIGSGAATVADGSVTAAKLDATFLGTLVLAGNSTLTGAAQKSANLSDLQSVSAARTNLGLGNAAVATIGTGAGQVASATDSRIVNSVQNTPGYYIPSGWGTYLKSKLASKAKIAVVGDSVTRGFYTSNLDTKSWPGLLKARLQGTYGNGGTGWKGVVDSTPWMTTNSIGSISSYASAGNLWTLTGTWSTYGASSYGIGGASISCNAAASASITVTGTTIKIFTIGGNGSWTYQIDGGAPVAGAVGSYQTVNAVTITGLAAGAHTVQINWVSGTVYLNGVSGENATGVVVDNFAQYGGQTGYVGRPSGTLFDQRGMGGYLYPADCVIWALGLNDAAANNSVDNVAKNFRIYMEAVKDSPTGPWGNTDVMIVMAHPGKYDDTNRLWQSYCDRMLGAAQTYGAAYVNIWQSERNSYNYSASRNMWGNATAIGANGSDSVHISDTGATLYYGYINQLIAANVG